MFSCWGVVWIICIYLYWCRCLMIFVCCLSFILWLIIILMMSFLGRDSWLLEFWVSFILMIVMLCFWVIFLLFLLYVDWGIKSVILILGFDDSFLVSFLFMVDKLFFVECYFVLRRIICNFLLEKFIILVFWVCVVVFDDV